LFQPIKSPIPSSSFNSFLFCSSYFLFPSSFVIPLICQSLGTNPWELACRGLIQAGTAPGTLHPKVWIRLPFFLPSFSPPLLLIFSPLNQPSTTGTAQSTTS
jgi:hypothetical protein